MEANLNIPVGTLFYCIELLCSKFYILENWPTETGALSGDYRNQNQYTSNW